MEIFIIAALLTFGILGASLEAKCTNYKKEVDDLKIKVETLEQNYKIILFQQRKQLTKAE